MYSLIYCGIIVCCLCTQVTNPYLTISIIAEILPVEFLVISRVMGVYRVLKVHREQHTEVSSVSYNNGL